MRAGCKASEIRGIMRRFLAGGVVERDFRVGPWLIRPNLNTISQNGTTIRVEPKVMAVLVCLASSQGDPVSKEKLINAVWPDTFVSDDVLTRSISELRRIFQDDARQPRFIETIPKRGYRLLTPTEARSVDTDVASPLTLDRFASDIRQRRWMALIPVVLLFLIAGMCLGLNVGRWRDRLFRREVHPVIRSIAVLPLSSLSSDPSQQYFTAGVTDALITELSHVEGLRVISRTSVLPYGNPTRSLPQIAKQLNVDALVEGTVQRSGERMRITAQLIYAPADQHLWANNYERDTRDVLSIEEDVAKAISQEIRLQLTAQRPIKVNHPANLKALEAYLQGQYHRDLASPLLAQNGKYDEYSSETRKAVQLFQTSIREDPNYAPAYVGLGQTLAWDSASMAAPLLHNAENIRLGRIAAEKAASLDPSLADAHLLLARYAFVIDWDWSVAEREFRKAIELNPNLADAHDWYAQYLDAMGRLEEGRKEFELVQQLDPGNQNIPNLYYDRRDFERVIELRRVNVERHAYGASAHYDLSFPLVQTGRHKEAVDEWIETLIELNYLKAAEHVRAAYEKGGFEGATRAFLTIVEEDKNNPGVPTELAPYLYTLLGDKEHALAGLEFALRYRCECIAHLRVNPDWDPLRSDPRFKDLLRRVGLPE